MNNYMLESEEEFARLEKQSRNRAYDFKIELKNFHPKKNGDFLDAGCGSGVVTRHLAEHYPEARVKGCDFSEQRVDQANEFINSPENKNFHNLSFSTQNLTKLTFDTSSFDAVICRYVLEHMSNEGALESLKEIYRCVRPGGQICVIDFDGLFYNLYPQTNLVRDGFTALSQVKDFDLNIGRKLPHLMSEAGFTDLDWEIRAYEFEGENLKDEVTLIRERIALAMPMLTRTLGSSEKAHQFSIDYFKCLEQPGAVLFYNKFIITGHKTGLKIQK